MNIQKIKRFFSLSIFILLLKYGSNTTAAVQQIPMQQIGEDTTGDGSFGFDIITAYAGSFDGLLMLTVVYAEPAGPDLYSNTTIRNANGDLFLVMAASGEFNNFVILTGATSLEEDAKNSDIGEILFWEDTWRAHVNNTELTFFVDWINLGGEGPIDIVFWTGRPQDNPDKLPNTGHLSFDGVAAIDKIGYLDDPERTTTTIIIFPTSESDPVSSTSQTLITTITVTEDNTSQVVSSNQTETPNTEAVIQISDIIPLSKTYVLGLIVMYLVIRKIRR